MIHTLTALTKDGQDSRTFGHYRSLKRAMQAVRDNRGEMHECLYTYLVVESVPEGVLAQAKALHWFRWDGRKRGWTEIAETPFPGVVNFGMG